MVNFIRKEIKIAICVHKILITYKKINIFVKNVQITQYVWDIIK